MMNAMKQNQWESGHKLVGLAIDNRLAPVDYPCRLNRI